MLRRRWWGVPTPSMCDHIPLSSHASTLSSRGKAPIYQVLCLLALCILCVKGPCTLCLLAFHRLSRGHAPTHHLCLLAFPILSRGHLHDDTIVSRLFLFMFFYCISNPSRLLELARYHTYRQANHGAPRTVLSIEFENWVLVLVLIDSFDTPINWKT